MVNDMLNLSMASASSTAASTIPTSSPSLLTRLAVDVGGRSPQDELPAEIIHALHGARNLVISEGRREDRHERLGPRLADLSQPEGPENANGQRGA